MCCYRDIKNFERFHLVVQSLVCLAICQLKNIDKLVAEHHRKVPVVVVSAPLTQSTQQPSHAKSIDESSLSSSTNGSNNNNNGNEDTSTVDNPNRDDSKNIEDTTVGADQPMSVQAVDTTNVGNVIVGGADGDAKFGSAKNEIDTESSKNAANAQESCESGEFSKSEVKSANETRETDEKPKEHETADSGGLVADESATPAASSSAEAAKTDEEIWTLAELEKLLILIAKAFLLNFPLYIAYKHAVHARLDDISAQDAQSLSVYCDLHENEMPVYLLRNVALFCTTHGFAHLMVCFDIPNLPVSTAHAITAVVSNLKLWLNYRSIVTLFVPIRSKILQYMRQLADQDLRSPATKTMADFMWTAIKDPLDTQITFDVDGLALAFKYFTSTTLTMRLAGMAQINTQINIFNDICTSETVAEVEIVGQKLSDWLNENRIIHHLFGPNLHVELIKQSPIILRFLAVENQITDEHLNLIWQAAQLKHCSKVIYDVLPPLVKNLSLPPALHMYSLLCRLDPKEHTEQSIFIASTLIKLIWSRDGSRQQIEMPGTAALLATNVGSSSENSVSMDGSNSDEEHPDDDSSDGRKSTIDIEGGSDSGPTPCKQPRHKNCCEEATDGTQAAKHSRLEPKLTHSVFTSFADSSKIEEIVDESKENIKIDST